MEEGIEVPGTSEVVNSPRNYLQRSFGTANGKNHQDPNMRYKDEVLVDKYMISANIQIAQNIEDLY